MSQESRAKYYEKAFERLDKTGKHTWNWAAFFGGITWMLYRRMYLYAFVLTLMYLGADLYLGMCTRSYKLADTSLMLSIFSSIEQITPRVCLMFLLAHLYEIAEKFTFHIENGWTSIETWEFWTIAVTIAFIITRICLGYFGNSLYYRIVKKRIRKGYLHLKHEYYPTSILSCFGCVFWLLAFVFPSSSKEYIVDKYSIWDYLNPNRRKT